MTGTIDDPVPNSAAVGVDMLSGAGNDPGNQPTKAKAKADDQAADATARKATPKT